MDADCCVHSRLPGKLWFRYLPGKQAAYPTLWYGRAASPVWLSPYPFGRTTPAPERQTPSVYSHRSTALPYTKAAALLLASLPEVQVLHPESVFGIAHDLKF